MIRDIFGIDFDKFIEFTIMVVILALILKNANGFSSMVRSMSNAYVAAVGALEGR